MPQIHRNALILHTHLPWMRHAESLHCPEEDWWLDAVTESLIPLLEMLHRLEREGIPYKITLAITPTVLAMLRDPLMQQRMEACLDRNLHLAHTEIERGSDPAKRNLAQWYADHSHRLHSYFRNRWNRDLVDALRDLRHSGHLEIPASAATHALLPLFLKSPDVLRAQINTGCAVYEECFGCPPKLFWLPDCAYSPALEPFFTAAGIEHIILNEHAVTYSDLPPDGGIYSPAETQSGLRVSCRDLESSGYIFKPEAGLAHDTRYREAHFALERDVPVNALKVQLKANGETRALALNMHCMDSPNLYDPNEGSKAAGEQSKRLLELLQAHFTRINAKGIINPLVTTVFESELFGHWRFEGIPFLEKFIRRVAKQKKLKLTHLSATKLSATGNASHTVSPIPSSWGEGGYFENWLAPENAWIYPHLHRRSQQFQRILDALRQNIGGLSDDLADHRSRCLSQMARELLLAQSSDWAWFMREPCTRDYATRRFENHLANFDQLTALFASSDEPNSLRLLAIEQQNPIFPNLDWKTFAAVEH